MFYLMKLNKPELSGFPFVEHISLPILDGPKYFEAETIKTKSECQYKPLFSIQA